MDFTRRTVLKAAAGVGAGLVTGACGGKKREGGEGEGGVMVNDMQSQLNATRVKRVVMPGRVEEIEGILREAGRSGEKVSVAGGRHAMGGQQFLRDGVLVDMRGFKRVVGLDREKGILEVEAGIEWPELVSELARMQVGEAEVWGIREKQTGVDHVTLGGSLASNVHGRGLGFPPIVGDVESFTLMDADGKLHICSRRENAELFSLAIGGYGLFGIITHVKLRLARRRKVERVVEVIAIRDLLPTLEKRMAEGCLYGDCQYSTDLQTEAATHAGVFSCYRPVSLETPVVERQRALSVNDWRRLYTLARTDKKRAFEVYSQFYLSTQGQVYWADLLQLAGDFESYRERTEEVKETEVLTEVYVRKENFLPLMTAARQDFLDYQVDMTYGTIRFIEKDNDTFLAWATEPSVCIVCNLHVMHTEEGKRKAAEDFRRIIDRAIEFGGRYFLTYHRWATKEQVMRCYPRFGEFLRLKRKYDPQERFCSDWYRHYAGMFG